MCKQTDGRTGRRRQGHTKLIDAFWGYVIAPKKLVVRLLMIEKV